MDKRALYVSLAVRLLIGALLTVMTLLSLEIQGTFSRDGGGWFVLTGLPVFNMLLLVMLVGADILWIIAFIVWAAQIKTGRLKKKRDKTLYLP